MLAGCRLKALLWYTDWRTLKKGAEKQLAISGIVISVLLLALAYWLSGGFSVHIVGYSLTGTLWGCLGFPICFVFAEKNLCAT